MTGVTARSDRPARPLRALTAGAGDPLVLLHAFGLGPLSYRRTLDRLGKHYRVVAPWLATPGSPWSFETALDAVEATVEAHELRPAVIVGHSFGGALALGFAARRPDRTAALVFTNALGISPGPSKIARLGLQPSNFVRYTRPGPARDFLSYASRSFRDLARAGWWGFRCHLIDEARRVREAGVPAVVLWGVDDSLLPPFVGELAAEALGAPLVLVERRHDGESIEHDWVYRHPRLFAAKLEEALTAARTAQAAQLMPLG